MRFNSVTLSPDSISEILGTFPTRMKLNFGKEQEQAGALTYGILMTALLSERDPLALFIKTLSIDTL